MKNLTPLAALLIAAAAHAGVTDSVNTSTTAAAGATNAGNAQAITFNQPGNTDSTIRSAPTVYAPNPITPFTQASCIYSASGGISFIGFGASGSAPIDGETCNWRLSEQWIEATAAGYRDLAVAGFRGFKIPVSTAGAQGGETALLDTAAKLMTVATNMQCLTSDRQRAVMEKMGMCADVRDIATLDHRFNQPRNYQIDYSSK